MADITVYDSGERTRREQLVGRMEAGDLDTVDDEGWKETTGRDLSIQRRSGR